MSDAADEDYSDEEQVVKRPKATEERIYKFLKTANREELLTIDSVSGNDWTRGIWELQGSPPLNMKLWVQCFFIDR